jgi:hypothetical protein
LLAIFLSIQGLPNKKYWGGRKNPLPARPNIFSGDFVRDFPAMVASERSPVLP